MDLGHRCKTHRHILFQPVVEVSMATSPTFSSHHGDIFPRNSQCICQFFGRVRLHCHHSRNHVSEWKPGYVASKLLVRYSPVPGRSLRKLPWTSSISPASKPFYISRYASFASSRRAKHHPTNHGAADGFDQEVTRNLGVGQKSRLLAQFDEGIPSTQRDLDPSIGYCHLPPDVLQSPLKSHSAASRELAARIHRSM